MKVCGAYAQQGVANPIVKQISIAQKLGEGESYTVPTHVYGVKVGTDIRLFLTNRKSWQDFISAAARAFVDKLQKDLYSEFMNGTGIFPVPSRLTDSGTLDSTNKADFDELIDDVATANECPVVIMGTKNALRKINNLVAGNAITWTADSQKEAIASTGILGDYEGTPLMEIPNRFTDKNLTSKLVTDGKLIIMPLVDMKPVKLVDYGETILEVTEVGATMNDQQTYELQRRMGISTIMTRYYGVWTF